MIAEGGKPPPEYHKIRCHVIFDIKMDYFRCTARLVAVGHVTKPTDTIMYESVVSRETVRVELTIEALNCLQVRMTDIQNAYIQAPVDENIWMVLGT